MKIDQSFYDEDYYEHGVESRKSCYQNYRWEPELTIPMAMTVIDYLGIKRDQTVLDFGCAKGYLVKALRLLYRVSWGYDISNYAISHADPNVKEFCVSGDFIMGWPFDFCIMKDVLEHMTSNDIKEVFGKINANVVFAVVPLGTPFGFIAPSNDLDKSHITCANELWWKTFFNSFSGWKVKQFSFQVPGIKDSYYKKYPEAHGFFVVEKWRP